MRSVRVLLAVVLILSMLFVPNEGREDDVSAYAGWLGADGTYYVGSAPQQNNEINISQTLSNSQISSDTCMVLDSLDRPHIVWGESVGSGPLANYEIFYAYWNGSDWCCIDGSVYDPYSTLIPNPANVSDTDDDSCMATIALDSQDNPHIAWTDITYGTSGDYDIFYIHWDDVGGKWLDAQGDEYLINASLANVSKTDCYSFDPRIALDDSDTPYIAWTDDTYGYNDIMCVKWGSTSWENMMGDPYNPATPGVANVSHNADQSRHCSLKLDSSGDPHLVWHDNTYGSYTQADVMYVHWVSPDWVGADGSLYDPVNGGPTWEPAADINVSRTSSYDSRFASLALDDDDNPHIVWEGLSYYYSPYEVLYVQWSDIDSDWVLVDGNSYDPLSPTGANISQTNDLSSFPNISLDSSSYPCVTWSDESYNSIEDIMFIRWNGSRWTNQAGNSYDPVAGNANVSYSNQISQIPNLALDSNDYPSLSWIDSSFSGGTTDVMYVEWGVNSHDGFFSIRKDVDADLDGVFGEGGERIEEDHLDYLIELSHLGGVDPTDNIYLYDTLPPHTTYDSSSSPGNFSYSTDGGISWNAGEPDSFTTVSGGDIVRWGPYESQLNWQGADQSIYYGSVVNQPMDINVSDSISHSSYPAQMKLDSGNNPHVVWCEELAGNNEVYYVRWDGDSWLCPDGSVYNSSSSPNPANISRNSSDSIYPHFDLDSSDHPHVTWQENASGNYEIYYIHWDGNNWLCADGSVYDPVLTSNPANVSQNPTPSWYAPIVVDTNDDVHIVWYDMIAYNNEIMYVKLDNGLWKTADGVTYSGANANISVNTTMSVDASVAVDSLGNPHVCWYDNDGNDEVFYVHWDGDSWRTNSGDVYNGNNANVSNNSGSSWHPTIAIDSSDHAHLAWYDNSSGTWETYYVRSDGSYWVIATGANYVPATGNASISENGQQGWRPSLQTDANDQPHIAWFSSEEGHRNIYYIYSNGGNWFTVENELFSIPADNANVSDSTTDSVTPCLALDEDSRPAIVWTESVTNRDEIYFVHYPVNRFTVQLTVEVADCNTLGGRDHFFYNQAYFNYPFNDSDDNNDTVFNIKHCSFSTEEEYLPKINAKKTANTSMAAVGDIVHYTITVENTGKAPAENIVVSDVLPRELQFISSNMTCSLVGTTVEFRIDLRAGERKIIRVSCRIRDDMSLNPGDVLTNIATVTGLDKPLSTNMGITIKSSNPGCEIPQMELRLTSKGKPVILAGRELDCEMLAHAGCNPFDVVIFWDDGKDPYSFVIGDSMVHRFKHTFDKAGDYLVEVHITGAYGKMTNLYKHIHVTPATD
jgi:uncharacterized repeat protein (TIGR01451 family)